MDDPDVARRRAEVLEGLVESTSSAPVKAPTKVVLVEGEELMSAPDRQRELYALAEEMELLFLNRISR